MLNTIGGLAARRLVASVVTHEAAQVFTTTVDALYRQLRGRPVTWGQFVEELIARLEDPGGIVVAALMSAIHTGAQYHCGAPRGVQVNGGGHSAELDMVRTRTIIEDKNARGLLEIDPRTGQPFADRSPTGWATKKIFVATVQHLAMLGFRSAATKADTPVGTTARPQPDYGTSTVPSIAELRAAAQGRNYQFRIDADAPALRGAVEAQLQRLRALYPGWIFTARYGG